VINTLRLVDVLEDVRDERYRQERLKKEGKFDTTCADQMRDCERLTVLAEEFGEVSREVCTEMGVNAASNDRRTFNLRAELIQTAAVCVAWVEAIDEAAKRHKSEAI
jgi:hypothetical protein